ncbi:MAG: hypothetical protein ABIJ12_10675 [bacterium]
MLHTRTTLLILSLLILTITATTVLTANAQEECCVQRGDIKHNGGILSDDILYLVNFLQKGGPPPYCWEEGNVDADPFKRINSADFLYLTNHISFPDIYVIQPCDYLPSADTIDGINISLIGVDGLIPSTDTIRALTSVKFHFGVQNNASQIMGVFSNGFRIYSPDGAEWSNASGDYSDKFVSYDKKIYTDVTGDGSDIIGFSGYGGSSGLPLGYDDSAFTITIGPLGSEMIGKTICIDSTWFPYENAWLWNTYNSPYKAIIPEWDGPHCFVIGPCCNHDGIRGDANYDSAVLVDDLTLLVNYLFKSGPPPPCYEEGDANADGSILVDDLVLLVDYLFKGGPSPADC